MDKKETQYAHFDPQILKDKKSRIVSSEEALKDVIPIDWGDENGEIPNPVIVAAMKEAEEIKKHPERYKRYSSFKEILEELELDSDE